jgi:serine protease Do
MLDARQITLTLRTALMAGACLLVTACVSYEPAVLVPAVTLSAEEIELADSADGSGQVLDFGLDVIVNESDSLLNVEILPGVRVLEVVPNGAADAAGIQVSDIILSVDGMQTNNPDALLVLQQQATNSSTFLFRVRRNTTVFEATVTARAIAQGSAPRELFRVDPIATRAGYRSELITIADRGKLVAARVVELFPGSPLPAAGIKQGDLILAIDDSNLNSAQDLVTRINQNYQLGDRLRLSVFDGSSVSEHSLQLWDPGRRISRISLRPLLHYEASLSPQSYSLSIVDLWLFSVYSYRRMEGERAHRLLGLFNFTSDYGELVEEQN